MPTFIDLTGHIFSRLTVLSRAPNRGTKTAWRCQCSCGTECVAEAQNLKTGRMKSCGCLNSERIKALRRTHGQSGSVEYYLWRAMLQRCYDLRALKYPRYGGRGIVVCSEWRTSFPRFYQDMGPRPEGRSLGRKDNDGPYSKENCRWETAGQQMNNTSRNHWLTFQGRTQTMTQWAREVGISFSAIQARINRHRGIEFALTAPIGTRFSKQKSPLSIILPL